MNELINNFVTTPSLALFLIIVMLILFSKPKEILQLLLELKDLNRKRLIQKLEENKTLSEMNCLNPNLKTHYERLCEEAQIHAIIGCQYCSKEMAQYIMSREDISRAIRWYNRVKDKVEIHDQRVIAKRHLSDRTIKYLKISADVFYWILGIISILGLALVPIKQVFPIFQNLSWSYTEAIIFFITLLTVGLTAVLYTVKLEIVKKFCTLRPFTQPLDEDRNKPSKDKVA